MKSIILGIKKGLSIPLLPPKLYNFYNHIFTRIFRFIGGLTVLLTVTKAYDHINLNNYLPELLCEIIIYSTYIFASIFMIFFLTFSIIRVIYGIYTVIYKKELFEVRNSPLDKYAVHIANILYCIKVGCVATGSTAALIATGNSLDSLIEKSGRAPIFVPLMGDGLNLILGKPTPISEIKLPEISKDVSSNTDFNKDTVNEALNIYKNMSLTEKEAYWKEVAKEFKKN